MSMFRRRYVTDVRYQMHFTVSLLRGLAIAVLVPACVFLAVFVVAAPRQSALLAGMPAALAPFLATVAALIVVTAALGVYLSHKYVGPLKRVEAWSARYLLGESTEKLSLRPGDELKGIATGLTAMAGKKPE